nr:ATP-grasp domain-containing protein [Actinomycetospora corticicola]
MPSPRHEVITRATELDAAAARVGFPAVLKPSLGAGSVGVRTVRSSPELHAAWDRIAEQPTAFLQHDPSAVLEARLPVDDGHEPDLAGYCSVEGLVHDGTVTTLGISDRLRLQHDCVEEGLVLPSSMGSDLAARVVACAERAIRAVGLRHGATHVEIATGDGDPRPIEVNARVGGPVCSMVAAATGRSLVADIAALALGRRVPPLPPPHATAWFRFVPVPEGDWRIAAQTPAAELLTRFPQLVYLRPRFEVGGHVTLARTQHLASFLVAAPDRATAAATAAEVERALGIDLQPVAALR